jgi:hypothetical protein
VLVELHLDLDDIVVRLLNAEDMSRFQVNVDKPLGANPVSHGHRLGDVVAARHVGVLEDSGLVAVDPAILRFLAAGEVGETWESDLAAMIAGATEHGWVDDEGRVRGHGVWPS